MSKKWQNEDATQHDSINNAKGRARRKNLLKIPCKAAAFWLGFGLRESQAGPKADPGQTFGNQAQIWDCDATNGNQRWNALGVTTPKSFVLSLKDPALCVTASANAANASVVIEPCSPGSVSQTCSDPANSGQVVIFENLCMSPATHVNDGTKIILASCDPADAAQDWGHGTGIINNGNIPKSCLDLTNGDETPGNQLQTWTCTILTSTTDNTNQDWIETPTF
ncbi:hypothetical protein B0H17DRAFT_1193375 [Mycena rosella]|uniref:Ricin B lectin domain-containing protein n=1 Tax=Mycena rosella TaxID=1033263 RepID=A0AAD7GTH5_MYCRO|nr:hypothetical protein B0H17DRAFT_1193375 [Mycena rosella]